MPQTTPNPFTVPDWVSYAPDQIRVRPTSQWRDWGWWVAMVCLSLFWSMMSGFVLLEDGFGLSILCVGLFVPLLWGITLGMLYTMVQKRVMIISSKGVLISSGRKSLRRQLFFEYPSLTVEKHHSEGGKGWLLTYIKLTCSKTGQEHVFHLPGANTLPEHQQAIHQLDWVFEQIEITRLAFDLTEPGDARLRMHEALKPLQLGENSR